MLLSIDNPRLVINAQEFPAHVVIMALRFEEASGEVVVNYLDGSRRVSQTIQPTRQLNILDGMVLHEFVLPFWELHDRLGRRGATGGFHFVANSSFRAQAANYGVRTLDFTMQFPVIGGGILRFSIGGQEWDLANPTFNPNAEMIPINRSYGAGRGDEYQSGPAGISNQRVPDDVLINAYRRVHQGMTNRTQATEIERRRQERIANFDLREGPPLEERAQVQAEEDSLLTGGTYREPPTRIPAPPGMVILTGDLGGALSPAEQRRQERLAQVQASEAMRAESNLVLAPSRAPKAPPRTRFERTPVDTDDPPPDYKPPTNKLGPDD